VPDSSQYVRDLVWAINSPPLLRSDGSDHVPGLNPDAIDPEHLTAFCAERSEHRVGHYFENLIHYWLKHIRRVEIIAHRLPVRDEEKTLGELDFIFRDEAGRLVHWEVAVKFYLVTAEDPPRHLGPNTSDSLARKALRLRQHQLPLSGLLYDGIAERHAFVKGLIHHHAFAPNPQPTSDDLHPQHLRGVWLHQREWPAFLSAQATVCPTGSVLKKPHWLTATRDRFPLPDLTAMVDRHFRDNNTALHVAGIGADGEESCRVFVVADDWPNQNT